MEPDSKTTQRQSGKSLYASVFLVSLSLLVLEIGFARIFSVMFDFDYEFLVISLAILGLGMGGMYVHKRLQRTHLTSAASIQELLPHAAACLALSLLLILFFVIKFSFFQQILVVVPLVFLPFFFGGIFLSTAFHTLPERSSLVYAADLLGAAVGAWMIVALLKLGGVNLILLVAVIASVPALIFSFRDDIPTKKLLALSLTGGLLLLFVLNFTTAFFGTIPAAKGAHKEMRHLLEHPARKARVLESRWSAFGRTDLVADETDPDEMVFFIDGTAGTAMYRFDGDISRLERPEFTNFSGYFPFQLLSEQEKEKVLIIGAGGGREVLLSLLGGAKEITAVEVNRDLVDLMRRYSDFNGGLYNGYPGVTVVTEEGRQFIRATEEQYDVILLSIPVTKTSRSPEGFVLTESFLFTTDSINDYLDKLTPNGRLVVVAHRDFEIFRLLFTSLSALNSRGISTTDAMKQMYTVGPEMFPVFVLKKSAMTPQEAQSVHENMHVHGYATHASFIPFVEQEQHRLPLGEGIYQDHYMLNQALYLLAQGDVVPDDLVKLLDVDIRPVTDNTPFFYNFEVGLPRTLIILLVFSAFIMAAIWLKKPGSAGQETPHHPDRRFLLIFSALGVGFMLIEIPLIQQFTLFLGQPVYAVATILFSLLLGAGIGSWLSGTFWEQKTRLKLRLAAIIVVGIVVLYLLFLASVFASLLGATFAHRLLVAFALLFPLGCVLGMPFPLGMKLLDEQNLRHDIPRMWGLNGVGSVFGSALAIALAVSFGFSYALSAGAVLYLCVFGLCSFYRS